jgi:N-sulfoglucosamine sulfohydrolase
MPQINLSRRQMLQTTLLAAPALAAVNSNAQNSDTDHPNIIWLIADDVGAEDIACYGHPTIRTPHLDRLAQNGIRFTNAFVTTSSCSPSRASTFTGKYPHATGAENLHDPLPAEQKILPECLREVGYYSGSVQKWHLGAAAQKKLDFFSNKLEDWKTFLKERPKDRPFFLSVGFTDAHRPFDRGCIPEPYSHDEIVVPPYLPDIPIVREHLAGFYDEITRMDGVIGEIVAALEQLGILENTMIIFFGDNGKPFPRAKSTLYDSGIHTPLIVHYPRRINTKMEYHGLVSLVDLAPTLLRISGLPIPEEMQGRSLLEQIHENSSGAREYIFAESNWHDFDDHVRAVRDQRYKYIRNYFPEKPLETSADSGATEMFEEIRKMRDAGTLTREQMLLFRARRAPEELYDLNGDPNEFRNLAYEPAYQKVLQRMRQVLNQWEKETADISPSKALPDEFHPETGERIRPPHQEQ